MTNVDLEDHFARQSGQIKRFSGAHVKFNYEWIPNEKSSLEEGRPIKRQIEKLTVRFPGSDETVREVEERDKFEYKELYDAFIEREKAPAEGTPLADWTLMPRGVVDEMKFFDIKTVEQLSAYKIAENNPHQVFLDKWQKRARKFVLAAKDAKNQVVSLSERNEILEAKVKKYEEQALLLLQRIEASEGVKLINGTARLNI